MKWIKLFEGFREDELAVEEELYRSATARYKKAVRDIEAKYKDRYVNTSEQDLNTIDICIEPLVDEFGFALVDEEFSFHREGMRHYAICEGSEYEQYKDISFTKNMYNALIKANRRIQSELPNREIYIRFATTAGCLPEMRKLKIPKSQCLEGVNNFVRLDYVTGILKEFIGKKALIAILA